MITGEGGRVEDSVVVEDVTVCGATVSSGSSGVVITIVEVGVAGFKVGGFCSVVIVSGGIVTMGSSDVMTGGIVGGGVGG